MATSNVTIMKGVGLVLLAVLTGLGINTFSSRKKEYEVQQDREDKLSLCDVRNAFASCLNEALTLETAFVAMTAACLAISAVFFLLGFIIDIKKIKVVDLIWHGVAGVILFLSAILMLTAAFRTDLFRVICVLHRVHDCTLPSPPVPPEPIEEADVQKSIGDIESFDMMLIQRLIAGTLAILNSILYIVSAYGIGKGSKSVKELK